MQLVIIEINFLHSHPLGPKLSTADIAKYLNIDEEFAIQMIHKYKSTAVWKEDVAEIEMVDNKDDVLTQIVDKLLRKVNNFEEKFLLEEQRREIMQKTVDELTEKVNRFENNKTEEDRVYREVQARKNEAADLIDTNKNLSTKDGLVTEAENAKLTAATIQEKNTLSDRIEELKVLVDASQHKCHDTWIPIPMVKTAAECKQEFKETLKEKFDTEFDWGCSFYDDKETITEDQQRRIMDAICYEARFRTKVVAILSQSHIHANTNYTMDISLQNIKLDLEEILNMKVRLYRAQQFFHQPYSYFNNQPSTNQPSFFNNRRTPNQPSSVRAGYNTTQSLFFNSQSRPVVWKPFQKFDNNSRPKHFTLDPETRNCVFFDRPSF